MRDLHDGRTRPFVDRNRRLLLIDELGYKLGRQMIAGADNAGGWRVTVRTFGELAEQTWSFRLDVHRLTSTPSSAGYLYPKRLGLAFIDQA